jgi:hypothetical protein
VLIPLVHMNSQDRQNIRSQRPNAFHPSGCLSVHHIGPFSMKYSMYMRRQVQCYMYAEERVFLPCPVCIHTTLLWHSERHQVKSNRSFSSQRRRGDRWNLTMLKRWRASERRASLCQHLRPKYQVSRSQETVIPASMSQPKVIPVSRSQETVMLIASVTHRPEKVILMPRNQTRQAEVGGVGLWTSAAHTQTN